jgi:hypothetical protein
MMLQAALRALLLLLALTGATAAVVASRVRFDPANANAASPSQGPPTRSGETPDALDSVVIRRNAFRADRRPAPVSYDLGGPAPPPAEPPLPLSVAGVVLGRTRAALLRGLPGLDGVRVLAEGEAAAGVRVLRVVDTLVVVIWRADTLSLPLRGGGS